MTEARNKFNQRAVSKRELSDTARHHVYEDLLIGDDFRSGFNEVFFHNWVSQATDEDPRREWDLMARLREIGAEKLPGLSHVNTEKQSARFAGPCPKLGQFPSPAAIAVRLSHWERVG